MGNEDHIHYPLLFSILTLTDRSLQVYLELDLPFSRSFKYLIVIV
jgi:hypothetical protein